MSSDCGLTPSEIVRTYSFRFKIEVTFHVMEHLIDAFYYHFWTQARPKLKGRGKRNLERLTAEEPRKFDQAVEAIERFFNLGGIPLGLLQFPALTKAELTSKSYQGWIRTWSSEIPSERAVQDILRSELVSIRGRVRNCRTLRIIAEKARKRSVDAAARRQIAIRTYCWQVGKLTDCKYFWLVLYNHLSIFVGKSKSELTI